MTREIVITPLPFDEEQLRQTRATNGQSGALITFLGLVRDQEGGQTIRGLDYEAHEKMAHHQFNIILNEIERRWPIHSVRVFHRNGFVQVNEPSLYVEVAAPHRPEAFAACQHLIDEMKRLVPVWKRAV